MQTFLQFKTVEKLGFFFRLFDVWFAVGHQPIFVSHIRQIDNTQKLNNTHKYRNNLEHFFYYHVNRTNEQQQQKKPTLKLDRR